MEREFHYELQYSIDTFTWKQFGINHNSIESAEKTLKKISEKLTEIYSEIKVNFRIVEVTIYTDTIKEY